MIGATGRSDRERKMTSALAEEELADYLVHCRDFPLLSIHDDAHLDEAIAKIDGLIDREELSPGEQAYLAALSDLVELYEDEHVEMPRVSGAQVVRHLMEAQGLQQKDLVAIFGAKSTVSAVLSGKRPLTLRHITKLSERFGLPADVFIGHTPAAGGATPTRVGRIRPPGTRRAH